ncbi:MAG: restriction endonuclease subunit S, partial [Geitlerinemataceae cyanobacterium]
MIPESWKIMELSQLISSLDSGISVNAEDRPASEGEIGVLKLSAVSYGHFNPKENKVVLSEELHRVNVSPKKNRIIISRANTPNLVGANVYIDRDYPNLFLPDLLWQIEPKTDNFSVRWLSYLLNSTTYRIKIQNIASGSSTSMIKITKSSLLKLEIVLPSLPEQCKIAEILGAWDDAISTLEKLITAKRKLKQGLMQQLLTGKKRFKEFE